MLRMARNLVGKRMPNRNEISEDWKGLPFLCNDQVDPAVLPNLMGSSVISTVVSLVLLITPVTSYLSTSQSSETVQQARHLPSSFSEGSMEPI